MPSEEKPAWTLLDNGSHLCSGAGYGLHKVEVADGKAVFHFGNGTKIEVNSFGDITAKARVEVVVYPAMRTPVLNNFTV